MNETVNKNHELKLIDRNFLNITGINKIISFDSNEFILESIMGPIHITGLNLELINLNTTDGTIKIKGKINSYSYINKSQKNKEESFIAKLFK